MRKVVLNSESLSEALRLPVVLGLSDDIKRNLTATHVMLDRYRRTSSLKEGVEIDARCVRALVLFDNRTTDVWHFDFLFELRKLFESGSIDLEDKVSCNNRTNPLKLDFSFKSLDVDCLLSS